MYVSGFCVIPYFPQYDSKASSERKRKIYDSLHLLLRWNLLGYTLCNICFCPRVALWIYSSNSLDLLICAFGLSCYVVEVANLRNMDA